jgi:predicted membrane protein
MGNAELDLTAAQMSPGTSEIEVRCIFGNVEIRVPPDIRVECNGDAFMGSFELEIVGYTDIPAPDSPRLLITGGVHFGSVTVRVMGTPGPTIKERLKSTWEFFYR